MQARKLTAIAALSLGVLAASTGCKSASDKPAAPSTSGSSSPTGSATAMVEKSNFGKTKDGQAVELYRLTNKNGVVAKVMTRGATLVELLVPDRQGTLANVNLGFDSLAGYEGDKNPFFGTTVGRYANRIAKGKFTLDGKEYTLFTNDGPASLHGGKVGFDKKVWKAEQLTVADGTAVKFTYVSPDMEEGYPGTLTTTVVYTLTDANELRLDYTATTDKPTVLNLTNHSYWNLGGAGSGKILNTVLQVNSDSITAVDANLIPTGAVVPVAGTPFDFNKATSIGARIEQVSGTKVGYDHNFVIRGGGGGKPVLAVRAKDPKSGRVMEVWTDQPGVQLYTSNFMDDTYSGLGGKYGQHNAFCLETQHYPDSPNHPNFPSTTLRPGEIFHSTTIYKFSAE